jgi:hypothetical protein
MANFTQFQCDTCRRKTEQLNNTTHATLTKCNITYKCTGTLIKTGTSDTKTLTSSGSQSSSLQNWVPRGTVLTTGTATVSTGQVPLNSAQDVLSIAVATSLATADVITMSLEIKKTSNNSFVEYMYNRGTNVSLITGKDDSSQRLSLSFANGSNPDILVVYVNGVQLDSDLFDRSVAGRIVFNPILTADSNLIRILVYTQVQASYATLTFNQNTGTPNTSAWANINTVEIPKGNSFTVYTCSDVSSLLINSFLIIDSITIGETVLNHGGYFLRANAPYSNYDRDLLTALPLSSMISEAQMINYTNDSSNSPKFFIDADTPTSLFPPMNIASRFSADVTTTSVSTVDTILANSYIT